MSEKFLANQDLTPMLCHNGGKQGLFECWLRQIILLELVFLSLSRRFGPTFSMQTSLICPLKWQQVTIWAFCRAKFVVEAGHRCLFSNF